MKRLKEFLEASPIITAITYTVLGVLPLYLTAAQSVRLQEELGFGRTQFGLVIGAFYVTAAIGSKRVGPALDRRGPDFGFRYGGYVAVVAALTAAAAQPGWIMMAIALALTGAANSYGQIAANLVVATEVPSDRTGRAFAAKQAAVPVGAMLAGLAVPWVGLNTTWRVTYLVAAAVSLVLALSAPSFARPDRPQAPRVKATMTPALAAFMVMAAIGGGIGNSLASFVTDASVTNGFSQNGGARLLTVGSIVAISSRLGIGFVADRRNKTGVLELSTLLGVAVVGLVLLSQSAGSSAVFITGVLLAFAGSWGWQGGMFYSVVRMIRLPAATATGAVAAGAYFGTVIMPPLVGLGANRFSYQTVFGAQAGLALVGIAAITLSKHLAESESETPEVTPTKTTQ